MAKMATSAITYDSSWGIEPTPDVTPMSVYEMFAQTASRYPDKPALIFIGKKLSFRQLNDAVRRFANGLISLGIQPGDRIASLLPNSPQQIIAFLAANLLGAIYVPINVMYKEEELSYVLADSGAKHLITLDLFLPNFLPVKPDTAIETILVTTIDDYLPFPINFLYRLKSRLDGSHVSVTYNTQTLPFLSIFEDSPSDFPNPAPGFDDTAMILYTAGTTGKSKGVMLTNRNFVFNAANQSKNFGLNESDVNLVLFPMFHIGGYLLATLCMFYTGGITLLEPRFDAHRYLKLLHKHRVTLFFAPPPVYTAFLNQPKFDKYDLSALKVCGASGAPVPIPLQEKWKAKTGLHLLNGYGLTETTAGAIVCMPNKFNDKALGVPLGAEAKIVNEKGETVPIGEQGEILFRGQQVAKGYWNKPEETEKTFVDGWLHTGDVGTMDEDGFIYFVDRQKDLIIASAYNISPSEVEAVLLRHPAVQEAAVIGVPDEYRGETVKAFVVLHEDFKGKVSEKEIIQFGKEHMAAYKYPRIVEFVEDLPKNPIQKVLRKKLREREAAKRAQGN
ncbi:MAG: long-chain fatty acid--CoA ligase [Calditrichaeota bacterium]|nr:long-chain fatty acid--CoA ligase [Calditrichota bacterium]